jgi:hypothetical protein
MIEARRPVSKHATGARVVVLRDWRCLEPMDEPSPTSAVRKRDLSRRNAEKWQPLRLLLSPPMIVIFSAVFAGLLLTALIMWVSVIAFSLAAVVIFHVARTYLWPRAKSWFGSDAAKPIA